MPAEITQYLLVQETGQTTSVVGHSDSVPRTIEALGAPSPCSAMCTVNEILVGLYEVIVNRTITGR